MPDFPPLLCTVCSHTHSPLLIMTRKPKLWVAWPKRGCRLSATCLSWQSRYGSRVWSGCSHGVRYEQECEVAGHTESGMSKRVRWLVILNQVWAGVWGDCSHGVRYEQECKVAAHMESGMSKYVRWLATQSQVWAGVWGGWSHGVMYEQACEVAGHTESGICSPGFLLSPVLFGLGPQPMG